ncbi:unnamed protein product [Cochlearia groenlandica]
MKKITEVASSSQVTTETLTVSHSRDWNNCMVSRARVLLHSRPGGESVYLWDMIADVMFIPGKAKGRKIRHPTIRYVRQLLSHALFPRHETGSVHLDEMAFLQQGLAPIIRRGRDMNDLFPRCEEQRPSILKIFFKGLQSSQHWAWSHRVKKPTLSIGGWITPILRLVPHVSLQDRCEEPRFMDMPFMAKLNWFDGELDGSYGYTFDLESHQRMILLPNERWTSFRYRDTVYFQPNHFYNAVEAPLVPIRAPRGSTRPIRPPRYRFDDLNVTTYGSVRYRPGQMAMLSKP